MRITRVSVLLAVSGFAGFAADERVKLQNASGKAVLFVSGTDGEECVRNKVVTGTGTLVVGSDLGSADDCRSELSIFSRDKASQRLIQPDWSQDPPQPLVVSLAPRLAIGLNVVVPSDEQSAAAYARADVTRATVIFNQNKAGLRFKAAAVYKHTSAEADAVGTDCGAAAGLRAAGPPLYDPKRINVYYVHLTYPDSWTGYNCFEQEAPNVIYISIDESVPPTLAHELGHALNLRGASGHTNLSEGNAGMDSFSERNLMYSESDLETSSERDHLSIGQAFRMNWDAESYLNEGNLAAPARAVIPCQASAAVAQPCPLLSLDPQ